MEDENYSLKIEATEVIKEIKFAVQHVSLSEKLKNTDELVFMNIETLEKKKLCVELSAKGFLVCRRFATYDFVLECINNGWKTLMSQGLGGRSWLLQR